MTEPTCERFGKWIGGCRFEPRYDFGEPTISKIGHGATADGVANIIEASKAKTYVADVCIRCGKQVKRPEKTAT